MYRCLYRITIDSKSLVAIQKFFFVKKYVRQQHECEHQVVANPLFCCKRCNLRQLA